MGAVIGCCCATYYGVFITMAVKTAIDEEWCYCCKPLKKGVSDCLSDCYALVATPQYAVSLPPERVIDGLNE